MEESNAADDMTDESNDTRLQRHNGFLSCLGKDTLLIVDYFDLAPSRKGVLDMMLKCRCRIIFTACGQYEDHILLEVGEANSGNRIGTDGKVLPGSREKAG